MAVAMGTVVSIHLPTIQKYDPAAGKFIFELRLLAALSRSTCVDFCLTGFGSAPPHQYWKLGLETIV